MDSMSILKQAVKQLRLFGEQQGLNKQEAKTVTHQVAQLLLGYNLERDPSLPYVAGVRAILRFAEFKKRMTRYHASHSIPVEELIRSNGEVPRLIHGNRVKLTQMVESLPDDVREVYRMSIVEEMDYETIAAQRSMTEHEVRELMFRAKEILTNKIASIAPHQPMQPTAEPSAATASP